MDANNDDAAIAEFHAAARKRNFRILLITSVVCLLIGVVVIIVAITAGSTIDDSIHNSYSRGRALGNEIKVLIFGCAFIVAGIVAAVTAFKTRNGTPS
jgi:uncharacterized membrane protein HdeD (DUF308 family)